MPSIAVVSVKIGGSPKRPRYRVTWLGQDGTAHIGTLREAQEASGLRRRTVEWRIAAGWSVKDSLEIAADGARVLHPARRTTAPKARKAGTQQETDKRFRR